MATGKDYEKKLEAVRFLEVLNMLGTNSYEIKSQLGLTKELASHLRNARCNPSKEVLARLVGAYPNANIVYILTGNGTPLINSEQQNEATTKETIEKDKHISELETKVVILEAKLRDAKRDAFDYYSMIIDNRDARIKELENEISKLSIRSDWNESQLAG